MENLGFLWNRFSRRPYDSLKCLQYVFVHFLDVDHHRKLFETSDCPRHCLPSGVKSQELGGQFTGPKREIRRSPNLSFNKSIVAELCDMLRRPVGTTAPEHHDCSIQE
ncbi:hypothetical protein TNCV_4732221 [Trichonephila clavipes]|nr:hypothetical protein TNCV_4732221 [Trichonephila clavipes]